MEGVRIVARLAMSLDGYIADADGGYDWIRPDVDDRLDTARQIPFDEFLADVDLVVMGRRCYDEGAAADYPDKEVLVATSHPPGRPRSTFGSRAVTWWTSYAARWSRAEPRSCSAAVSSSTRS